MVFSIHQEIRAAFSKADVLQKVNVLKNVFHKFVGLVGLLLFEVWFFCCCLLEEGMKY